MDELGAERLHHPGPALAEVARRQDKLALPGRRQVGNGGLECARSGRGEHQHVVLSAVHVAQPREDALVDLPVVAGTVMDDRLRERGEHLRRHGRRPRREQVALPGHVI